VTEERESPIEKGKYRVKEMKFAPDSIRECIREKKRRGVVIVLRQCCKEPDLKLGWGRKALKAEKGSTRGRKRKKKRAGARRRERGEGPRNRGDINSGK